MEEAEALCDRIGIVDHGRLLALGTLEELRAMIGERDVLRLTGTFDPASVRAVAASLENAEVIHADEQSLILAVEDASRRLPAIFRSLADSGAEVQETTLNRPTLESLFIKLTGRELRE
jgi:linearmycin/streptolysin S transport system ATP-binding protein